MLTLLTNAIDPGDVRTTVVKFEGEKDREPKPWEGTLRDLLGTHVIRGTKAGAWAFSPVEYEPGATRGKGGVVRINCFVADLDHCPVETLKAVRGRLAGKAAIIYTTWSHGLGGEGDNGLRVVLPLSRGVMPGEFSALWDSLQSSVFCGAMDPATRGDYARIFYLPVCSAERAGHMSVEYIVGEVLIPDRYLIREGDRNRHLTSMAGVMRRKGAGEDAIVGALLIENSRCIDETGKSVPLNEHEVRNIAKSVAKYRPEGEEIIDIPRTEKGKPIYSPDILKRIFEEDSKYRGKARHNAFKMVDEWDGERIGNEDYTTIREDICGRYKMIVPKSDVCDAIEARARANSYCPVQDWLRGLVWDGTERLKEVAGRVLGAVDEEGLDGLYNRYVRLWWIGLVARVMVPGCKNDTTLILQGGQGIRKSTFFECVAGQEYFRDTMLDLHSKDALAAMAGNIIVEWAELETVFRKADMSVVKGFLTSREDEYRPPYGRVKVVVPRRGVVVGSTNEESFLFDDTGSRRFWVMRCGGIDIDLVRTWKEQLWAEAKVAFDRGEGWWLVEKEEEARATANSSFERHEEIEDDIGRVIEGLMKVEGWNGWIDPRDVYRGLGVDYMTKANATRYVINRVFRQMGFRWKGKKVNGRTVRMRYLGDR